MPLLLWTATIVWLGGLASLVGLACWCQDLAPGKYWRTATLAYWAVGLLVYALVGGLG